MKCFSCGVDKDLSKEAIYPYPEDETFCDEPISQLLPIECQGKNGQGYRMVIICHDCWHRLEQGVGVDMWIGEKGWEFLNPVVPFDKLPKVKYYDSKQTNWNAGSYDEVVL
jgi:hypothetical protein